jgi:hypothetical protein
MLFRRRAPQGVWNPQLSIYGLRSRRRGFCKLGFAGALKIPDHEQIDHASPLFARSRSSRSRK